MTFLVAITMREMFIRDRGEKRDGLETGWWVFLAACGITPLCLPNDVDLASDLLQTLEPNGLILTGGDEVALHSSLATNRDKVETLSLNWAVEKGVPAFGVCRGMQKICIQYGGQLRRTEGHSNSRHRIRGSSINREVNSYHDNEITSLPQGFDIHAVAQDGCIEWIQHRTALVSGIMWHPERCITPDPGDIKILRSHFRMELA